MNLSALAGNRVIKLARETLRDWMEDKALRLAAALAYYSVFSIAPMLVIAVSMAGLVFGEEAVRGQLDEQLRGYIGAQATEAVQTMVQGAAKPRQGIIGATLGFVILIVGASGVFGQLKDALNTVWEVKAKKGTGIKGIVRERLLSFGMVLVIGFLLLTSLLLTTALAALNQYLGSLLGIPAAVWAVLAFILSMAMVTTLFAFIFKVLPDANVRWRNVWIGALVTAVLFELGKFALAFYLGRESTASTYGAAASVVLLLLWVYYASCILLLGAEFTQVYSRATGHVILPTRNAEPLTPGKRAQEGLTATPNQQYEHLFDEMPVHVIQVPAKEPGGVLEPAGLLLLATAASFVAGLVLRRWGDEPHSPSAKLREGLAGVGGEAVTGLTDLLDRTRQGVRHAHVPGLLRRLRG